MSKTRKGARRESAHTSSFLDHQRAKREVDKMMRDLDRVGRIVERAAPAAEARMRAGAPARFGDHL